MNKRIHPIIAIVGIVAILLMSFKLGAALKPFSLGWTYRGTNPPPQWVLVYKGTNLNTPLTQWTPIATIKGYEPSPAVPAGAVLNLLLPPDLPGGQWKGVYYDPVDQSFTTNQLMPASGFTLDVEASLQNYFVLRGSNEWEGVGPFSQPVGNHGPPDKAVLFINR